MTVESNRNATALATLRIVVGFFFLLFGQYKVFGSVFIWHGGFEQWIRSFIMQGAYPWMKSIIEEIILPHVRICAFLTAYGELMIGLGLVAGVLTHGERVWYRAYVAALVFGGVSGTTLRPLAMLRCVPRLVSLRCVFRCFSRRRTRSSTVSCVSASR